MDDPNDSRADAKLRELPKEDLLFLWSCRNPAPGEKKLTYTRIRAEILPRYGTTMSGSTLSDFYAWLKVWKRWQDANDFSQQARAELAKNPLVSDEELDKFADRVMKTEVAVNKDVKGYVAIRKLGLAEKREAFNRDKLTAASKSQIEKGLDALLAEIQGNTKALAAFQIIQKEVKKG
jgi:hypothetical protein